MSKSKNLLKVKKISTKKNKSKKKKNKKKENKKKDDLNYVQVNKKKKPDFKNMEVLYQSDELEIIQAGDDFDGECRILMRDLCLGDCKIEIKLSQQYKFGDIDMIKKMAKYLYSSVRVRVYLEQEE